MSDVAGCAPPPPPHPPPTGGWGGGAPPPRWGWVANPDQKEGGGRDTRIGMTANTPSPRLRLTLFDLDHTLLPIDSDHAWGAFTTRIGWTDPAEFERRNDAFYADYQAGTLDVHDYVRFATAALRRHGPEAAAAAQAQFMREVISPALRPQALALVQRHQRAGDEVLIVTATNHFLTPPLPFAHCLGAGRGRRRAAGHAVGARRQRLVQRRDRRLALHARGQTAAHGTMAGRPATGLGGCRKPLLQRFDERPAPAGKGRPPRRHQPRAAPAGAGARAGLAHTRPVWHTMIKKFIDKMWGKAMPGGTGGKPHFGRREEVPASVHGIDPELVDRRAADVVATLKQAGFAAYIVGGAVRDLLLGLRPKDFDVATDATPEQVKSLFRRAFIIGRRFRIVHVVHGRGREHEVLEVSTFRPYLHNAPPPRPRPGQGPRKGQEGATVRARGRGRLQWPGVARQRLGPAGRRRHAPRLHHQRHVLRPGEPDRGRLPQGPAGRPQEDAAHDRRADAALPRRPGAHHPRSALCGQAQRAGLCHRRQDSRPAEAVAGPAGRCAAKPHVR